MQLKYLKSAFKAICALKFTRYNEPAIRMIINESLTMRTEKVRHISKVNNWNRQGESGSRLTDELVSAAVTELPAWG